MNTLSDIIRNVGIPDDFDEGISGEAIATYNRYSNRLIGVQYQVYDGETDFISVAFECKAAPAPYQGKFVIMFDIEDGYWEVNGIGGYTDFWHRIDQDVYGTHALFKIKFDCRTNLSTNRKRVQKFVGSILPEHNYLYQIFPNNSAYVSLWIDAKQRECFWESAQEKMTAGSDVTNISIWGYDSRGKLVSLHEFEL